MGEDCEKINRHLLKAKRGNMMSVTRRLRLRWLPSLAESLAGLSSAKRARELFEPEILVLGVVSQNGESGCGVSGGYD